MRVRSIYMHREGDYGGDYQKIDYSKPFNTTIKLEGGGNKMELQIPPEVSDKIMRLIADEVVKAGRAAAEALTFSASVFDSLPAPAPEAPTLPEDVLNDEIPF